MKYKTCIMCKQSKSISKFSKAKSCKDGYRTECKDCWWNSRKEFYKHNPEAKHRTYISKQDYKFTKKGVFASIYEGQKEHFSNKKRNFLPNYSLNTLRSKFMYTKKFNMLFSNWIKSGYKKDLKPSVDRINCKKGYRLSNLQIMTWKQNSDKGHEESRIPIIIMNRDNQVLAKFKSKTQLLKKVLNSSGVIFV